MNKLNLILVFMAISFLSLACKTETPSGKKVGPLKVKATEVSRRTLSIPVLSTGTLASETQSNLSFMTGGIINRINVDEGQEVRKGQVLASLDLTEIDSRLQQTRLGLEKAERDFRRVENLYRDSVATLEQYQDAKTALELARTNHNIASFNKKHSLIQAPANGKILKKMSQQNEIVAPGYPVFAFASTESEWVLRVNLSDRDIVRLSKGDSALIQFDAYPGEQFRGQVSEIANAASLMNGTYEVEIRMLEKPARLVSGLIGKARIFPVARDYLVIPHEAIFEAKGLSAYVFKLEENKVMRQPIQIYSIIDEGIIIRNGLSAGDRLVSDGNNYLNDGEQVEVVD
jgi:RND family efflux transporter MFP subunit